MPRGGEFDEGEFLDTIDTMVRDGSLILEKPTYRVDSMVDWILTPSVSGWFWWTAAMIGVTIIVVNVAPNDFPLNLLRVAFGSLFLLYLPGYSLLKFLLPKSSRSGRLERYALNVGVSLVLVPLIVLILNFTPFGIGLGSVVIAFSAFTFILAVVAALRDYSNRRETA